MTLGDARADGFPTFGYYPDPERLDVALGRGSFARALEELQSRSADLAAFAGRRAQNLLADHRRVREAADARGSYSVKSLLPPDVVALFVLLPRVD